MPQDNLKIMKTPNLVPKDTSASKSSSLTHIGNYRILELVGTGGIGQVFKAEHMSKGGIFAVKRLHENYQHDRKLLGLFHKEIVIHSQVSHRHCVKFIEADLTPGQAHIVTEFIDGINCYNIVKHCGAIPPIISCCIVLDLLQGLEHLHCLDIIHSDITPSNVIIEKTGRTVLADFGLSCLYEIEDYRGVIVGTPGYQAPERLAHAAMTPQADIYGVGIIFYELLRGERLFYGLQNQALQQKMKKIDLNWINTGHKRFNSMLKNILACSLSFYPEKRFATPRDFMYAIYQCLKIFNITHTRRAILQWLVDKKLTHMPPQPPKQTIYIT